MIFDTPAFAKRHGCSHLYLKIQNERHQHPDESNGRRASLGILVTNI